VNKKHIHTRRKMMVQTCIDQTEDDVRLPFHRALLVDRAKDVISLDLPEEILPEMRKRKRRTSGEVGRKTTKGRKKNAVDGEQPAPPITIKFKVPKELGLATEASKVGREKQYDSDGDTVGGYSSDEDGGDRSSQLTSLPSESNSPSSVSRSSPFAHCSQETTVSSNNHYLSTIADSPPTLPTAHLHQPSLDQILPVPRDNDLHQTVVSPGRKTQLHGGHGFSGPFEPPEVPLHLPSSPAALAELPMQSTTFPTQVMQRSLSQTSTGLKRRRKPPPKEHIVRAPKYASPSFAPLPNLTSMPLPSSD
jgi:hypothetical protein